MSEIEKLDLKSMSVPDHQLAKLKQLFPEVFTEGDKIDWDRLRLTLGTEIDTGKERFGMNWPGKADCFKTIQQPSIATLVPMREESVDFDTTQNLFIEGDNLEVLKLLQKSYLGKIKMIYIDPPYNTGNDFIYPDNYSESLETYLAYTGQIDAEGRRFSTNTETDGRFHSKWMNMMYPRLFLAKNLLKDDGLIFISIDDHEVHSLRAICNEIFGGENFIAQLVWNTEGHTDNQYDIKVNHEYILIYAKNSEAAELGYVVDLNTRAESNLWKGFAENSITKNGSGNPPSEVVLPIGFPTICENLELNSNDPGTKYYEKVKEIGYVTRHLTQQYDISYPIRKDRMFAKDFKLIKPCRVYSGWANVNKLIAFIENSFKPIQEDNGSMLSFYISEKGVLYYKRTRDKARNILSVLRNLGTTEQMRSELEKMGVIFQYPKPKELLKYLITIGSELGGTILDFFAGSCTTAHAVIELNRDSMIHRNFICVQIPEQTEENSEVRRAGFNTIAQIGRVRIKRLIESIDQNNTNDMFKAKKSEPFLGFKAFKLTISNFSLWDSNAEKTPEEIGKQLQMHIHHISPEATQEAILYELLLKSGFELTTRIEKLTIEGKTVFSIEEGVLLICLEKELTHNLIKAMAERTPTRVICLDEGFQNNDQLKTNAVQIMKSKGVVKFQTV